MTFVMEERQLVAVSPTVSQIDAGAQLQFQLQGRLYRAVLLESPFDVKPEMMLLVYKPGSKRRMEIFKAGLDPVLYIHLGKQARSRAKVSRMAQLVLYTWPKLSSSLPALHQVYNLGLGPSQRKGTLNDHTRTFALIEA